MPIFSKKQKNKAEQKSWREEKARMYPKSQSRREKRSENKFSRFLFWLLFLAFFGICAYLLLFSPFLAIDKISVEGNRDVPSADIISAAEKSLEGKYFGIFPKNNFFLISKKNIGNAIKAGSNRLEVSSVEKKFPDELTLKLVERKAELVWCSGGVCYFVDGSGLVYEGAAGSEEELRNNGFLVAVDDSAIPAVIGKTKISPDFMAFVESASAMIRDDLGINASESFHTPAVASREISVKTGEGWILKMSLEYSVDESKKIIQMLFDKDLNGDARKNLDYLDLTVKNKIYYKLKS